MTQLHRGLLDDACRQLACSVYPNASALAQDIAETLAHQCETIALRHVDFITALGRDPNIVTRAVHYLREAHARSTRGSDLQWFAHMLECVLELAVPGSMYGGNALAFLDDIAEGVTLSLDDAAGG